MDYCHRQAMASDQRFAEAAPEGDAPRRKMSGEEIRAVSKRLFRRSTLLDANSAATAASEMAAGGDSSSDEDPPPPRVVGIQVAPEGPIYELPPPPRKVPPPPPVRRDSLQAPPGESLLPPPSRELFLSDDEDSRPTAVTPAFPLPPKKFPNPHAGLLGTTTATADEQALPRLHGGAELTADASATSPARPARPGVVHFAAAPPTVVLVPLSPEDVSSPRKKSATLGNFLDTHETSWKFTPGHQAAATPDAAAAGDHAPALGAPPRKDSKDETMTSSSDTDDFEDLPPPPLPECGTEDSTDSSENIYEDIGPVRVPMDGQRSPQISVATLSLVRPPKSRKFARSLHDVLSAHADASKAKMVELQEEGKNAIDTPGSPTLPELPPQDYVLDEMEERAMIEPPSYEDPKFKELIAVLIEWINDELASHRIIVKDIEEDLFDGQVLQKLLEKLSGKKLDVVEVTQSEEGQKQKLKTVVDCANQVLGLPKWGQYKWSVESIHQKNVVSIIHLLVALARHFRAPVRLPENVVVNVVVVQKRNGILHPRTVQEELTSTYDDLGMRVERDAFDTLFDHAPDKLQVVKKSLMSFVNKHLNKINLEVSDLDTQFQDGIYLVLLMGLVEGYFVPLYSFFPTPSTFDQKVHNVSFSFTLMTDAGLPKPKARPEDLVNADLKSTLRVLYNLFTKYKDT
ncbi:beta-parvin-like [Dermacentor andersoni]|uniref:beta-parvin-like n=1 Tax=Dermacentor andersoni TaxID=34620 RepID=UPI002155BB90|nr:beta-parvin-like [Dermacentor andersoni]